MKTWRVLLVDDETPARRELRHLLAAHPDVEIVGEAARAADAVSEAARLEPDLIFLDIEMPDDTGLAIAEQLPERAALVFVTAYDAHPLRAFEVGAFDYLLKPVRPERMQRTLDRLRARASEVAPVAAAAPSSTAASSASAPSDALTPAPAPTPPPSSAPLLVGTKGHAVSATPDEIAAIVATGHFTDVFLIDGRKISEWRALREWEELLGPGFPRVHRRTLLALRHVRELRVLPDGGALALARGWSQPFRVSRRSVAALRRELDERSGG